MVSFQQTDAFAGDILTGRGTGEILRLNVNGGHMRLYLFVMNIQEGNGSGYRISVRGVRQNMEIFRLPMEAWINGTVAGPKSNGTRVYFGNVFTMFNVPPPVNAPNTCDGEGVISITLGAKAFSVDGTFPAQQVTIAPERITADIDTLIMRVDERGSATPTDFYAYMGVQEL